MEYTPENINTLGENEIFVFGSNLAGNHAGGAARIAREKFGAVKGQGVGLQGQSYAIPSMQGGVETIKPYVDEFIRFAEKDYHHTYFVTRIGCGIAGFSDEQIAPLFVDALNVYNIRLPKSFVDVLTSDKYTGSYLPNWQKHYSSYDMTIDYLLTLNRFKSYTPADLNNALIDLEEMIGQVSRRVCHAMSDVLYQNYPKDGTEGTAEAVVRYLAKIAKETGHCGPYEVPCMRYIYFTTAEVADTMLDLRNRTVPAPGEDNSGNQFFYSLFSVMTGRWNCGDNRYIYDNLNQAFPGFKRALECSWQSLFTGEKLDEKKVISLFSNPTIWTEWKNKAQHGLALYRCISPVLRHLCNKNTRVYHNGECGVFVPRKNFTLPVFDPSVGRVHFPNFALKKAFIERQLNIE